MTNTDMTDLRGANPAERQKPPIADDKRRHSGSSLANGLAIIQTFDEKARAITSVEAAARTGLTLAVARRALMTLEDLGFVVRQGERHFVLTPKVLQLGRAYSASMSTSR